LTSANVGQVGKRGINAEGNGRSEYRAGYNIGHDPYNAEGSQCSARRPLCSKVSNVHHSWRSEHSAASVLCSNSDLLQWIASRSEPKTFHAA
jgi:hypothetical protein